MAIVTGAPAHRLLYGKGRCYSNDVGWESGHGDHSELEALLRHLQPGVRVSTTFGFQRSYSLSYSLPYSAASSLRASSSSVLAPNCRL